MTTEARYWLACGCKVDWPRLSPPRDVRAVNGIVSCLHHDDQLVRTRLVTWQELAALRPDQPKIAVSIDHRHAGYVVPSSIDGWYYADGFGGILRSPHDKATFLDLIVEDRVSYR